MKKIFFIILSLAAFTTGIFATNEGSGTLTASPSSVGVSSTAQSYTFIYTPAVNFAFGGTIVIAKPIGAEEMSDFSLNSGDKGYFTISTAGTISNIETNGLYVTITTQSLLANVPLTIIYGDKSGGGAGVDNPQTSGSFTWVGLSNPNGTGTPTSLSNLPLLEVTEFTATPTVTESITETVTETATETITESVTETATETVTESITETVTETATETITESITETATETVTETVSETVTETASATVTETVTESASPSVTQSVTETVTQTASPSVTPTITQSFTATYTRTPITTNYPNFPNNYTGMVTLSATAKTLGSLPFPIWANIATPVAIAGGTSVNAYVQNFSDAAAFTWKGDYQRVAGVNAFYNTYGLYNYPLIGLVGTSGSQAQVLSNFLQTDVQKVLTPVTVEFIKTPVTVITGATALSVTISGVAVGVSIPAQIINSSGTIVDTFGQSTVALMNAAGMVDIGNPMPVTISGFATGVSVPAQIINSSGTIVDSFGQSTVALMDAEGMIEPNNPLDTTSAAMKVTYATGTSTILTLTATSINGMPDIIWNSLTDTAYFERRNYIETKAISITASIDIVSIDYTHNEIHNGNGYYYPITFTSYAGTMGFLVSTTTKEPHVTMDLGVSAGGFFYVYSSPTVSNAGTAATPFNAYASSLSTSACSVYYNYTTSAAGTFIYGTYIPGSTGAVKMGSAAGSRIEKVLSKGKAYLIYFVPDTGSISGSFNLNWYEE